MSTPTPHQHPAPASASEPNTALARDLHRLSQTSPARRRWLSWLALAPMAPLLPLAACGGGGGSSASSTASTTTDSSSDSGSTTSTTSTCSVIPEETAGPYPGDGSNSVNGSVANALQLSGIVRSDITSSIAGASGTATGVPLTVTLKLVNTASSCASLAGYAVYLWHCDQQGRYSMYSSGVTDQNYLRGVQEADANGEVSFSTIFPGCYSGRMTHIHFEIYPSLAVATSASHKVKTSQLTFPVDTLDAVYAESGYEASVSNLAAISYATDNVFSDGVSLQIASVSGSVSAGYQASLTVGVAG